MQLSIVLVSLALFIPMIAGQDYHAARDLGRRDPVAAARVDRVDHARREELASVLLGKRTGTRSSQPAPRRARVQGQCKLHEAEMLYYCVAAGYHPVRTRGCDNDGFQNKACSFTV